MVSLKYYILTMMDGYEGVDGTLESTTICFDAKQCQIPTARTPIMLHNAAK